MARGGRREEDERRETAGDGRLGSLSVIDLGKGGWTMARAVLA